MSITTGPTETIPPASAAGTARAPEERPDPGAQLGQAERLGDVVVGAGLERRDLVVLGVPGGQDEDRRRGVASNAADQDGAIGIGQAQVEQDHVRAAGLPLEHRRSDVRRLRDLDSHARSG